jgi:uncharacterized repeat protein (TIGR02543 family)
VRVTASAATGSTFAGWSGACAGTAAACTVTMDAAKAVTASFNVAAPVPTGGVTMSATSLSFTSTSLTQTVTYTNDTNVKVTFISASVSSARFGQTNNCGELAPGAKCTATVTYYPANSGSDTGTLTITSTAPNSTHVLNLTGTPPTTNTPPASCRGNGKKVIVGRC